MKGIFAKIKTSKGIILIELKYKLAPGTVGNFINLAEGTQQNDHKKIGEPYYDGLKFHRVISDFMIQGGVHWAQEQVAQDTNLMTNLTQN